MSISGTIRRSTLQRSPAAKASHTGSTIYSVFAVDNIDTNAALSAVPTNLVITTRADDPSLCVPGGATTTVTLPAGQTAPDGTNPTTVVAAHITNVFHVGLDAGTAGAARHTIRRGARGPSRELRRSVTRRRPVVPMASLRVRPLQRTLGLQLGADLVLPSTPDAVAGLVTTYLDAHALGANDWIWVGDNPAVAAALTTALVSYVATHPDFAAVRVIADSRAFGEPFRDACGATCAGVVYGLVPITPFGDARPFLMTEVSKIYDEMHPGDPSLQTVRYVEGFVNAANWADAIRGIAVPNLPVLVPTVRNGVENGTVEGVGGLIPDKVFTTTDHRALHASEVYGIDSYGLLAYTGSVSIELTPETLGY